jgi:hypothetical protein
VARDIIDLMQGDPLWRSELTETDCLVPFKLVGDHVTRDLRIRFAYDPEKFLTPSNQTVLRAALKKAQDLKASDRAGALKGAAYHLTPLYEDIRWELLLSPKLQTKDVIEDLIRTARYTTL